MLKFRLEVEESKQYWFMHRMLPNQSLLKIWYKYNLWLWYDLSFWFLCYDVITNQVYCLLEDHTGKISQESPQAEEFRASGFMKTACMEWLESWPLSKWLMSLSWKSGRINISPIFIHHSVFTQIKTRGDKWCCLMFQGIESYDFQSAGVCGLLNNSWALYNRFKNL